MNNGERFELALKVLPDSLGEFFRQLTQEEKDSITEIRLRPYKPVTVITQNGICFVSSSFNRLTCLYSSFVVCLDLKEIQDVFRRVCGYSVYAFKDDINRGYITVEGGHRVGVAGTAVAENGEVTAVRDISCINIRIAREIKGAADEIFLSEFQNGICSVIIAGPPSSGKTTILRDLARQISGVERGLVKKVFVCDERGEIGASFFGVPQNDLGINCDLATGYPKSAGIMMGLRSFSPDIIICDEVACDGEIEAVKTGLNSGVAFALSIHAKNENDLKSKLLLKKLLNTGAFECVILLSAESIGKTLKIFRAGDLLG